MHGFGSELIPASDILCPSNHPLANHPHLQPQQPPQPPPPQSQPNQPHPAPQQQQQQNALQQQQIQHHQQQQQQAVPHSIQDGSKYEFGPYDESTHSDSYVSYLESDDSMTTPLSASTSP